MRMNKVRKFISGLCITLSTILIIACADKQVNDIAKIEKKDLKLVYIISNNIKFYDFGIIDTSNKDATLEIFKLGKSLGKFIIKEKEICFMEKCTMKWPASKSFFGKVSYDNLFEDILRKKDIFDGIGKYLEANGTIIQTFTYGGEKIYYERSKERVYFKNITNEITISIENYKE